MSGERLRIGPLFDARRLTREVSAVAMQTNPDELLSASFKAQVWGGTIGAEFDSTLSPQLNFYGFANWVGAGNLDGSWYVEFGLRYFLTPWLGINGGYSCAGIKIVIHDRKAACGLRPTTSVSERRWVFDQRLIEVNMLGSKSDVL